MRVFIRGLLAPARGGAGVIRSWVVGLLIALGALPGASLHAGPRPPDVNAVLAKLDDLYKSSGSIGKVEMTVVRPGSTRTLVMRVWTRGEDRALIIIDSPARGQEPRRCALDQNLELSAAHRAHDRIPPSAMLSPWMGSDFITMIWCRSRRIERITAPGSPVAPRTRQVGSSASTRSRTRWASGDGSIWWFRTTVGCRWSRGTMTAGATWRG